MDEDLKAELTCPICMDLFSEPRRLPCGHVYCRTCLQDMLTRKYLHTRSSERILSCPECRQRYDLTFRDGGVDCFPRDFKLVRLVELYEKRFASGSDAGDCNGGGDKGEDEQTAVKTVVSTAATSSARETSPAVEASNQPPTASRQLSREQLQTDLHSFGSSALTLSDDSWIYVAQGDDRLRRPELSVIGARQRERGDDSWLLPSADVPFPRERGEDVRGTVSGAAYRDGSHGNPSLNISGSYENQGRETFQRFVPEPVVENRPVNTAVRQGSTSDSSSESASSDERGEEGSGEDEDVSESASEGSSQRQNRRSRLTRFFRSLVLSDSDSFDDDEEDGHDVDPRQLPPQGLHHPRGPHHPHVAEHGRQVRVATSLQRLPPSHVDAHHTAMSRPVPGAGQGATVSIGAEVHAVPHSLSSAGQTGNGSTSSSHSQSQVESGSSLPHRGNRNSVENQAAGQNCMGPSTCVGVAMSSTSRNEAAIEAASDDSDEDYEAQTSMLRPKRKPRSRLKKFFTSLLSLSSSDEEDEVSAAQAQTSSQASPSVTPDRS